MGRVYVSVALNVDSRHDCDTTVRICHPSNRLFFFVKRKFVMGGIGRTAFTQYGVRSSSTWYSVDLVAQYLEDK
jgi:hypothetical protein